MSSLSFYCVNVESVFTDSIKPASMRTNQQFRGNKKSSQAEKPLQHQSLNKGMMLARWWRWGCMQRCDWPISRYVEMIPTAVSARAIDAEQQRSNRHQECCFALGEFQVLSPETTGVTQELWPLQRLLNILSHLHTEPSPDHWLFNFHLLSTLFFFLWELLFPGFRPVLLSVASVVCRLCGLCWSGDSSWCLTWRRQHWQQEWKVIFRLKQVGQCRLFFLKKYIFTNFH